MSRLRLRANRSSTISRGSSPVSGSNVERNNATYSMELLRSSNRRTPVSYTGRSRSISRLISANNTPFHVFDALAASLHSKRKQGKDAAVTVRMRRLFLSWKREPGPSNFRLDAHAHKLGRILLHEFAVPFRPLVAGGIVRHENNVAVLVHLFYLRPFRSPPASLPVLAELLLASRMDYLFSRERSHCGQTFSQQRRIPVRISVGMN